MTSYRRYLKRIIPCVVLFLALVVIVIFNLPNNKPSNPVIIPDDNTPLSDRIQAKASFYLFNPGDFTPDFTNVTPDLAEYIGEGSVYFTGDIYNNPSEVSSLIVSEPNYSSFLPSDKAVSWGSIYLYSESKEICVIGLSADKSEINPIAVNDPSSVRSYGAKGDGVTDDTEAIKNAIANNTGGIVYFPNGTYVISSVLRLPSNTQIIGQGKNTIILAAEGTPRGSNMLQTNGTQNIVLKNISISGNSSVNYENMNSKEGIHLLDIWNSENITINNCVFRDNINIAIRDVASNNITISECLFKEVDCGFITMGSCDNIHDIYITNNTFDGHKSSEPVSLFANAAHTNVLIEKNTMLNKTLGTAILIDGKQHNSGITIRDNSINACSVGMIIQNSDSVQILNNNISDTKGAMGIKLADCNSIVLKDNSCTNIKQDGLQVANCSNVTIDNLTTIDCGVTSPNYFNIRFSGEKNDNITFSNSSVKYDLITDKIGICFACETDITMDNIDYSNATIWMTKNCSNTSLSVPASVRIRDQGLSNTITQP